MWKYTIFVTLITTAMANVPDFCGEIAPHLPDRCSCTSLQFGAKVGCAVDFLDVDTIGITASLDLCTDPASADIRVNDTKLGIDHELAGLTAGKLVDIPIPGLSLTIPKIGSIGVNAVFDIEGDLEELDIKLGIDACGKVLNHDLCGARLTKRLPIYVLDHTFNFGSLCTQALEGIFADPSEDECNQKKDQSSCDALGCSWCTAGAVPPSCHTIENAAKLPSAVFKCDKTFESFSDSLLQNVTGFAL